MTEVNVCGVAVAGDGGPAPEGRRGPESGRVAPAGACGRGFPLLLNQQIFEVALISSSSWNCLSENRVALAPEIGWP